MQKRVKDKIDLVLLFNSLKQRACWQETESQLCMIQTALRLLLVPEESLEKTLQETCCETVASLKKMIRINPNKAKALIEGVVKVHSAKHDIDEKLVWDRIMEALGA